MITPDDDDHKKNKKQWEKYWNTDKQAERLKHSDATTDQNSVTKPQQQSYDRAKTKQRKKEEKNTHTTGDQNIIKARVKERKREKYRKQSPAWRPKGDHEATMRRPYSSFSGNSANEEKGLSLWRMGWITFSSVLAFVH